MLNLYAEPVVEIHTNGNRGLPFIGVDLKKQNHKPFYDLIDDEAREYLKRRKKALKRVEEKRIGKSTDAKYALARARKHEHIAEWADPDFGLPEA